ncbi:hypothetical protein [Sagittula sp. SSi028]|uniref:hypothetical protein n=1 Tax=Sagittula sp. SSi028 TaxID=3400636 RepID=UPI003AF6D082
MRFATLILMLSACLSAPVSAADRADYLSDGFGLVPLSETSDERAQWSGVRGIEKNKKFQSVKVRPGDADTCAVFVGPKSLVAGQDEGHAVTLTLDVFGNLVADGLPVTFRLGDMIYGGVPTRNGIGDLVFAPPTEAGSFAAGAEVDSCQSPRALYRVTADLASVALTLEPEKVGAPEQVIGITTAPLADRYGNPVEDGTAITVLMEHGQDDGTDGGAGRYSQLTARSIGAVGQGGILTRDMPVRAVAGATLATTASDTVTVEMTRVALSEAPELRLWAREDVPELRLRVGPLTTDAGHLLYEGADVAATVRAPTGGVARVAGWARDGYVWLDVPLGPEAGGYEVRLHTAYGDSTQVVSPGVAPRDARKELVQ